MMASALPAERLTEVWPGQPYPRGANWDGQGVNFALFSQHAQRVELCLFDASGRHEQRIELRERTADVWHCYLPQARPGLLYGWRVHGPWEPEQGHRFNPHKLLLDPYARDVVGAVRWHDAVYGYAVGHKREDLAMDRRDSAPYVPKARVVDSAFSWGDDRPPAIARQDMVVYELNVRGFTRLHPLLPESLRGTYAGLCETPVIDYLRYLGVTTVELMPVHAFLDDRHLVERGLRNYWGYNTLCYFAPEPRYAASPAPHEFKSMVRKLHSAGIEVVLDVVYNHTCEGNHLGPTLSLRGIDNCAYYILSSAGRRWYEDFTGCGNTVNLEHPHALQLVMDSLRYWVQEMHVDGFRFDLASALAREAGKVENLGAFFNAIRQDPVLNRVKLIAEPWDLGHGGYQVGNFPAGWSEWNDRYRDAVRGFWRGDAGLMGELTRRLTGSEDFYGWSGRRPYASINFVTAHDGFTLHDLVAYNDKHNEANGEDNRDGHNHNLSWNCGVEGPTDDAQVNALRERQKRNLLTTLLLSQGVPMLMAGDTRGHTQVGNNNAYCQDNELSWIDWSGGNLPLTRYVAQVIRLRNAHPSFRRKTFFRGEPLDGDALKDVSWLRPDGAELTTEDWHAPENRCVGMLTSGHGIADAGPRGQREHDDDFLMLLNAHGEDRPFRLPAWPGAAWRLMLDTADESMQVASLRSGPPPAPLDHQDDYPLRARSVVLLARTRTPPDAPPA